MAQGILPFQYQVESASSGMTALAGLPTYLDLAAVSGLTASIERHLKVCAGRSQGWTDRQIGMALVLLNRAGGDCVEDLRVLEGDEGFARVLRRVETYGLPRQERGALERRWRTERHRWVPSPSAVFRYLAAFHDPKEEQQREAGRAFIPAANEHLQARGRVNRDLIAFKQAKAPAPAATLDMDATLIETHKRGALFSYPGSKAYQPLTVYWSEQDVVLHSEFRDGNVPAGYEQLRVFQQALDSLPPGVEKVSLRADTAGYEWALLRYCAQGRAPHFGVIEFAVGVDVTPAFKVAVAAVKTWNPLSRPGADEPIATGQEWAEVCFVPERIGHLKAEPYYRFLAIREPLVQPELPGLEAAQLPFPTMTFGPQGRYKVFGLVTNRTQPGDEVIHWQRARCGKGEECHGVMKEDLAGGQLPSGDFGENAAWWAIMVLACNLNALMKHLVLPEAWASKRLKALRFVFIQLAGRVLDHARQLAIRLCGRHPSTGLLLAARQKIVALAQAPPA